MWVFPAPVFTAPLPVIQGCPGANVDQSATAIGWNFVSHARAAVNTDNCTAITLYNSYLSTCKYRSAQQVLNLLTVKVLPGFERSEVSLVDLTRAECDALNKPVSTVTNVQYIQTQIPAKVCPKGQKKNSKGICYKPVTKPTCKPKTETPVCTKT